MILRCMHKYEKPDKFFTVNDDPDLTPITVDIFDVIRRIWMMWNPDWQGDIPLLKPNLEKCRNYGLPPEEQYWSVEPCPKRLLDLEKKNKGDQNKIWHILEENREEYAEEINYIRKQWYHRHYGEWIFINGKLTYISPWHWFFLCYWEADYEDFDRKLKRKRTQKNAQYRDVDRRVFLFYHFAYTDTRTFEHLDEKGVPIPKGGKYTFLDVGTRICYGVIRPKGRRVGATEGILSIKYDVTSRLNGIYSSTIANSKDTAMSHWNKKFIRTVTGMRFFFKPISDGSDKPKRQLDLSQPAFTRREKNKVVDNDYYFGGQLKSWADYSDVADPHYYDHSKIHGVLLNDEGGKNTATDVFEGWDVIKPAMSLGGGSTINRYATAFYPSTVEEMELKGGLNYKKLCDTSDFYKRNLNSGQTASGLYVLFIPAQDGLENFIGPYGESIIDDPTPEQAEFIGRKVGAKQYLADTLAFFKKQNTDEFRAKAENWPRLHPTCYADCWRIKGGDMGFDMEKLNARVMEINRLRQRGESPTIRGDMKWVVPGHPEALSAADFLAKKYHQKIIHGCKVIFEPCEDGRFVMSKQLNNHQTSRMEWNMNLEFFQPIEGEQYIASADPVMYHNEAAVKMREDKSRASGASGAVFWDYDDRVDYEHDINEWESNRFVCSYLNKPNNDDEYSEEMLMMSVYWNALMFPETNVQAIVKYFEQRRFGGYLKYAWEVEKLSYKDKPGFHTGTGAHTKTDLFSNVKNYIDKHVHRENHLEIIMQWVEIKKKEEMTKYDLFVSSAGCLYGQQLTYRDLVEVDRVLPNGKENWELTDWYDAPH